RWLAASAAIRQSAARARLRRVVCRRCAGEDATPHARPSDRRALLGAAVRRDRRPACLPARRLDADRARFDGRAGRLDALPAAVARPLPRPDPERGLERRAPSPGRDLAGHGWALATM